jgi:hypothetical protein
MILSASEQFESMRRINKSIRPTLTLTLRTSAKPGMVKFQNNGLVF